VITSAVFLLSNVRYTLAPSLTVNAVAELSDTAMLMSVPSALIESRAMLPTLVMLLSPTLKAPDSVIIPVESAIVAAVVPSAADS